MDLERGNMTIRWTEIQRPLPSCHGWWQSTHVIHIGISQSHFVLIFEINLGEVALTFSSDAVCILRLVSVTAEPYQFCGGSIAEPESFQSKAGFVHAKR